MMLAKLTQEDLTVMRDLMQSGKVTPVIDRRYKLTRSRRRSGTLRKDTLEAKWS